MNNEEFLERLMKITEESSRRVIEEANSKQSTEIKEYIKSEIDSLSVQLNDKLNQKISEIEENYNELKIQYEKLQKELKKNNLIVFGLNAPSDCNLISFVIGKINSLLELSLVPSDINDVYTIGKQTSNKPIILKLVSYLKKKEILRNCKKLKGTNIAIGVELTPEEQKEQKILRQQLKKARKQNQNAFIKNRKLVVNGTEFTAHELIADEESSDEEEEIETGLQEGFTVGQKAGADVNTPHEVAEDQAKGKEEQDVFITEIVKSTSKRKITQSAEPAAKQLRPRINSNPTSSKNKDSKQN
ncbi:unnamed protein product [Acanthoscelides obtectus]|uniref:Uncharacterized protein n=1 Tax=Acanthoscelides obtectus TaxID=200917 RepID=A0A9P0KIN0_ACAOB|nr:unnamed protein product [Acanthoscelides obtectus]CAK1670284.1 hypothetical protein AOBTE_LOCUS27532 [Acanthoscelides obtectus]